MTIEIKHAIARVRDSYDDTIVEYFIDLSPSERIYFAHTTPSDWDSVEEIQKKIENHKKELLHALGRIAKALTS